MGFLRRHSASSGCGEAFPAAGTITALRELDKHRIAFADKNRTVYADDLRFLGEQAACRLLLVPDTLSEERLTTRAEALAKQIASHGDGYFVGFSIHPPGRDKNELYSNSPEAVTAQDLAQEVAQRLANQVVEQASRVSVNSEIHTALADDTISPDSLVDAVTHTIQEAGTRNMRSWKHVAVAGAVDLSLIDLSPYHALLPDSLYELRGLTAEGGLRWQQLR